MDEGRAFSSVDPAGSALTAAVSIGRIHDLPVEALEPLLAESEAAGLGFVRRLVEEWGRRVNRFDSAGEALFVARSGDKVVGVCGLNVDPYSANSRVGRVRHLYVLSELRRQGIGRALVAEVIRAAGHCFESLRLRTDSSAAARFYEALGFQAAGAAERDATHVLSLGAIECAGSGAMSR